MGTGTLIQQVYQNGNHPTEFIQDGNVVDDSSQIVESLIIILYFSCSKRALEVAKRLNDASSKFAYKSLSLFKL
ncbi:hypothetical protein P8452_32027 [Trifolium repens]|nr:hypothetical protein P8452_32027 [Trifolium repens]